MLRGNKNAICKMVAIFMFMILTCSLTGCSAEKTSKKRNMERIVKHPMNTSVHNSARWYFFHKDRLYTYDDSDSGNKKIVSFNLQGDDKKDVACDERLVYPTIMMIYKDTMLYKTSYEQGIMALDLNTGKISNFVKDHYYHILPDTLKGNEVIVEYDNNYAGKAKTVIAKLNLDTKEVTDEKELLYDGRVKYLDIENYKTYYISRDGKKNDLYVDGELKKTLLDEEVDSKDQNVYNVEYNNMFIQDGYVFMTFFDKLFKLDADTFEVLEEKDIDKQYRLILSTHFSAAAVLGTEENDSIISTHALFETVDEYDETGESKNTDNSVYRFNSEDMSFEKIIDKSYGTEYVEKYDEYYVFQDGFNTVVYNEKSGESKTYNATNFSVEDGYIYMITYDGDLYHQKSSKVSFIIKKEALKDICK